MTKSLSYTTLKLPPLIQWAAVTTQSGLIRDPPHPGRPFAFNSTCHGQAPSGAVVPAITLPFAYNDLPQEPGKRYLSSKKKNYCSTNFRCSIYGRVYPYQSLLRALQKNEVFFEDFLSKNNQMDFPVNKHRSKIFPKFFDSLSVAKHVRTKICNDPT